MADWLTGATLEAARTQDDEAQITRLLSQWAGKDADVPQGTGLPEGLSLIPNMPTRTALQIACLISRSRGLRGLVSKRVPGLARESHWFMRKQTYMVPRHSRNFLNFATRLTVGHRGPENEPSVKKLLVHAFLEDLRVAYRRTRLKFLPRIKGCRRTGYVVLLVDNATAKNGAVELLRLISDVRNETGQFDPLLVIAAGEDVPLGPPR